MELYDLLMDVVMTDTEDIVLKDNNLQVVMTGSWKQLLDYATKNPSLCVEGVGCYDGNFTIILE